MGRCRARHLWGYVRAFKGIFLVFFALVVGCGSPQGRSTGAPILQHPKRIVSLDFCADQFVLKLADRGDIIALSPDATRDFSYLRDQASGLKRVRPTAEDVLALAPDLIVRSYGGGPSATAFFERAGVKVHQIGWGDDFDAVRTNVRAAADAMGQSQRGDSVVAAFDQRLAAIKPASGVSSLYLTSGGVTTGSGSMIDLMMRTAGLTNFQHGAGWNPIPLERLVSDRPQMMATAFFSPAALIRNYWSPSRHPIAQDALRRAPIAALDGSTTACAGWFVLDGVERLATEGRKVQP